ncbi:hypothetical protein EYM_05385 [Ignicoccus islandicus DSM 13165]|uniref:DUF3368 domain-containing protein n=1 Tax=Ignicoccus islandicus DSM 13165 TaxID=940295 RepID=A0A0U3DWJ1_9CREN|nr:DUF3368 domain-containing protein [Ignicoccus islandicus]ALU11850.1 hypothetical protein EYM_05385 [Ignicoccus islandicus DSM 13165]
MRRERESNDTRDSNLIVVSDSSVIIALARICRLDLLEKLFGKIIVPEAVWREVTVEGKLGREKVLRAGFIRVKEVRDRRLAMLLKELVDDGEAEAITLALEVDADVLLIDDRDARSLAKELGLQVMGVLGVLALAKYNGIIPEVKPIVTELVESGFWVSTGILEEFLRELGEY